MSANQAHKRSWRSSLYARAALFLALGAASFVGAVAVLSRAMVEDSVDRLLAERSEMARNIGGFVENRLASNLNRLGATVAEHGQRGAHPEELRRALEHEFPIGIYNEGAFALDRHGALLAAAPTETAARLSAVPLAKLVQRVDSRGGIAASEMLRLGPNKRPSVVLVQAVRQQGRHLGYVGGMLAVTHNDALAPALRAHPNANTVIDLVDLGGVVIASTDPRRLLVPGDHDDLLAEAMTSGRGMRGRCHGCHVGPKEPEPARVQTVLAFAPLPTIPLGISVQQPESEALAPAFALRQRLVALGLGIVALFLLFAGLAVRSIVDPIKRLTREVRAVEANSGAWALPTFGDDEMGALARTLERWRGGMLDSLAKAEHSHEALAAEMERTRKLLQALQEIAGAYIAGTDATGIVEHALDTMLRLLGMRRGFIRIEFADQKLELRRLLTSQRASGLLRIGGPDADAEFGAVLRARHSVPQGISIDVVLTEPAGEAKGEGRWLDSLVHQLAVSVTTRLLHDQELAHQQQRDQYLHRVMRAQEEERRRVARELHDTVAQDLAALRLEVERIAARTPNPAAQQDLLQLEQRVALVLESVRRTLFDLRLTVLENLGLVATLQWHLERLEKDQGIRGILAVTGLEREPPYETAVALLRIFQESLQNVVAHAKAEHLTVTLTFAAESAQLVIEDDGVGFDPAGIRGPAADTGHGLGLLGMQERARLVGGAVEIASQAGEGTTVTVSVPLKNPEVP